jgi:hypothetical protein
VIRDDTKVKRRDGSTSVVAGKLRRDGTLEDGRGERGRWALLTIEVRNEIRRIVQARGRFNRTATREEHAILMRWAGMNGLEPALGRWG